MVCTAGYCTLDIECNRVHGPSFRTLHIATYLRANFFNNKWNFSWARVLAKVVKKNKTVRYDSTREAIMVRGKRGRTPRIYDHVRMQHGSQCGAARGQTSTRTSRRSCFLHSNPPFSRVGGHPPHHISVPPLNLV